jgi:hypothetical protein
LREALGTIVATYTYFFDPFSDIKETNIMIRYEAAMLDAMGKFDTIVDPGSNKTYRKLFEDFRTKWSMAVSKYNSVTGDWKDSMIDCSKLLDHLMRIAIKENLMSVSKEMYNFSAAGVGAGFDMGEGDGEQAPPGGMATPPTMPTGPRRPRR